MASGLGRGKRGPCDLLAILVTLLCPSGLVEFVVRSLVDVFSDILGGAPVVGIVAAESGEQDVEIEVLELGAQVEGVVESGDGAGKTGS